ncbi:MAG: hypothetical protein ABI970_25280, partial [Chloroflexota bacterium]
NRHKCVAGRSAVAASAAVGSAKSAAALLGVPSQRMHGRQPPKVQKRMQYGLTTETQRGKGNTEKI